MALPRQQQNTQPVGISAPINGIVATGVYIGAAATGGEGGIGTESAIWLYNMIAGEYGCRVRPGSRDFATNIPDSGGTDGEIRTVMFYNSIVAGGGNDFIFAVTDLGIYDMRGWLVSRPVAGEHLGAGSHAVLWNGRNGQGQGVASGVYFAVLQLEGARVGGIQKMVLLK